MRRITEKPDSQMGTLVGLRQINDNQMPNLCSCKLNERVILEKIGGAKMGSAKEADVSKLGNPAWLKANHQARTELCV